MGLSAVTLFAVSFVIFAGLNPEFNLIQDYISKLGAQGQPYSLGWNVIGFFAVGVLLALFGYGFGRSISDELVAVCLAVGGLGFALAALPTDLAHSTSVLSKSHYAAICVSLAGWCFALARIGGHPTIEKAVKRRASVASVLLVVAMAAHVAATAPSTHRLVVLVVFGWVVSNCIFYPESRRANS